MKFKYPTCSLHRVQAKHVALWIDAQRYEAVLAYGRFLLLYLAAGF